MRDKQIKSGYINNEILEKIGFDDVSRVGILSVFYDMMKDDENGEDEMATMTGQTILRTMIMCTTLVQAMTNST